MKNPVPPHEGDPLIELNRDPVQYNQFLEIIGSIAINQELLADTLKITPDGVRPRTPQEINTATFPQARPYSD